MAAFRWIAIQARILVGCQWHVKEHQMFVISGHGVSHCYIVAFVRKAPVITTKLVLFE